MKKVLVTGATGLLGRVIVLQLLKQGVEVCAAKRTSSDLKDVQHSFQFYTENPNEWFKKIEWVDLDFKDSFSIQNALKDVSEVYHCAAKVSMNPKDRTEIYQTNLEGTKRLLYECDHIEKFCFISSVSTLDTFNADGQYDEECDFKHTLKHPAYATSKHFAEMEVWRAYSEGLKTVIVLPAMILGSGQWNGSTGVIFKTFRKNRFAFSGSVNFVDVRDVARMSIELMDKNIFGQRFIAVSGQESYFNFAKKVRTKLGLSIPKIIPKSLLNFGRVFNVFGFLIPALKMVNKENIEAVTSHHVLSNKKIKEVLNFEFIPLAESIDFHLENYVRDLKK